MESSGATTGFVQESAATVEMVGSNIDVESSDVMINFLSIGYLKPF